MTERVSAEDFLHQYVAVVLSGDNNPTIASGSTELDGKRVRHRAGEEYEGVVLGPAVLSGFVWVSWETPDTFSGMHRLADLIPEEDW